jgi:hypothetical protein
LPAGASYASGPANCRENGSVVSCFVGTLANGATALLPLQITWNAITSPVSILASVTSDLPDSTASNNTGTVVVGLPTPSDSDTPALPEWGMLLLGLLLATLALRARVA